MRRATKFPSLFLMNKTFFKIKLQTYYNFIKNKKEEADSLDEEEVAIVMEIVEVIERGRKDKLPPLRNVPKKKLLEETAKIDKVLSKFKIKTNELF